MAEEQGLGQRLRELRKRAGLTQEKLAEMLNLSYMTIRRWESEKIVPRMDEIQQLADVLNVTKSELLNGPSDGRVKITLTYDWDKMKEGSIDMTGNEFELILGSNGQIGLKGAGLITSREAIEEFLVRIRNELEIALDAQIKRGVVQG